MPGAKVLQIVEKIPQSYIWAMQDNIADIVQRMGMGILDSQLSQAQIERQVEEKLQAIGKAKLIDKLVEKGFEEPLLTAIVEHDRTLTLGRHDPARVAAGLDEYQKLYPELSVAELTKEFIEVVKAGAVTIDGVPKDRQPVREATTQSQSQRPVPSIKQVAKSLEG